MQQVEIIEKDFACNCAKDNRFTRKIVHVPKVVPVVAGILVTILIKDLKNEKNKRVRMELNSAKRKFSSTNTYVVYMYIQFSLLITQIIIYMYIYRHQRFNI